ncbi:MAG: tripartite tricarboxylate transporter substrate binding protein [Polaromonas sp.]|nr:tripartite tricarboxylate transporter substrate binding protein [Polaromonas sp.]
MNNKTKKAFSRRDFIQAAGAAGLAGAAAGVAPLAYAQSVAAWPNKPIKFVVGFAPGGLADNLPRLIAPAMSERLGQQIIIENRTGAAGNLATTFVAKAPPDGYNILATSVGQIVVSPHTSASLSVNPLTDLKHISMIGEGDQILNINAAVPAQTLAEFIALAKKAPGTMFYGDAGAGGSLHLYLEYFKMLAGIDLQPVHYRGTSHLLPDFLTNRVQLSLNGYPAIEGYIREGKLRPLMLVGRQRDPRMPGVPTAAEAGFKPMEACSNWFGLHAPKDTPDAIVQRLHAALVDALKTDAVKAGLATNAIRAVGDTPQAFTSRIAADYEAFGKVARSAKIQAE